MNNLLKITNVEIVSSDKKTRILGGIYINFLSKENVIKNTNFKLVYNEEIHYFKVTDISIEGENLNVKAVEVGYWSYKFDQKPDFDLRNLIGLSVSKIDDTKTIEKIHEMSCWC